MSNLKYDGFELEYFDNSKNFRKYQLDLTKKFIKNNTAEVGPGRGGFVYYYKKYCKFLHLIEPDRKLYGLLKQKYSNKKITIKNSTINKVQTKFDTIMYFDVLEHIQNDLKEVLSAKKRLKKNGYLIFSVPAFQIFYNNFDKSVGHYRRYNKKDFINIASKTNLKIQKLIYYDSFGLLLIILGKIFNISNKNLGKNIKVWNFFIPLSKILDLITFNKFGKSLICVFKND